MAEHVERCPGCGQFVYRLRLWITQTDVLIDAGTKSALIVDDLVNHRVADIPVMKLTEETPAEVWTKHECKGVNP